MRDYVNIGSVPAGEDCQQVGTAGFDEWLAQHECRVFLKMLRRVFGEEPDGAQLRVKSFSHDFGSYREVVCYYDDRIEESIDYAFRLENDMPEYWDDEAKLELSQRQESFGY